MTALGTAGAVLLAGVAVVVTLWWTSKRRNDFVTQEQRITFETLHTAWSAAPPLRAGLVPDAARKSARHLRTLLGTPALALTDEEQVVAWEGAGEHHSAEALGLAREVFATGRTRAFDVSCVEADCPVHTAVLAPLTVEGRVVGVLAAYSREASAGLVRATNEVARWASGQLELAELDRSRTRLVEAEVRALRAQISPHFIYNSLSAIASYVRTNPERARTLLLDFADFTRYSFRRAGDFTTLSEELRSIDQYLALERARFGERLQVTLQIAPEVLPVTVPFLCLQPLVENAVRHGMEGKVGPGLISITAEDAGDEARITVEDDGIGMDPDALRRTLAGKVGATAGIGLGNIDERLRRCYGDDYGLVVETAQGLGTKVSVRVPKYRAGVHAD
ncbi:histidine kinase [Actinosynnema mirum]|uniref:Signal transduction histidine kinase, LytS n=1 Tax=Actinosynnema mirum (strain ATCC 29888 / DSM 43827 / JCM 3225 / NBRC 14064 / NCIMB 13271 / NRRL B-12336 / IMRU 3971 / 101) TaxID=446462 RepID=C6W930_ACTMD|nr:histidine kinase [Actinosynnema mirum]ACU39102.1 signal transduction histidine kinase, LytS [Actinosynnema mirum DSM 43827]AXX32697.1 Autolysis histidine kinase LytS [Actinosynnema pretiosum subsp. pretiosum]